MSLNLEEKLKDEIFKPTLVIDYDCMKKNIDIMAIFANENTIDLKSHIKTHKCPKIGKMQSDAL